MKNLKSNFKLIINIIKKILGFIIKIVFKTKHGLKITTVLVFFFIAFCYKTNIIHSVKVYEQNRMISNYYKTKINNADIKELKKQEIELLKEQVTNKLQDAATIYQNKCVSEKMVTFIDEVTKKNTILIDERVIEAKKDYFKNTSCNIEKMFSIVIEDFGLKFEYNKIKEEENFYKKNNIEDDGYHHKEIKEDKKEIVKESNEILKQVKNNKNNLKAIFCDYGHGVVKKSGIVGPGAIRRFNPEKEPFMVDIAKQFSNSKDVLERGYISERDIILRNHTLVCNNIKNYIKDNNLHIKFYELGLTSSTVNERNDYIYKVSKENGYNVNNSLLISFHVNSIGLNNLSEKEYNRRKGISQTIVFYSDIMNELTKGKNRDFAESISNSIKKIRPHGVSFPKADLSWLGMVSGDGERTECFPPNTEGCVYTNPKNNRWWKYKDRPMSVLIEIGFITNDQDVKWMLKKDNIVSSTTDGILNYIKKNY